MGPPQGMGPNQGMGPQGLMMGSGPMGSGMDSGPRGNQPPMMNQQGNVGMPSGGGNSGYSGGGGPNQADLFSSIQTLSQMNAQQNDIAAKLISAVLSTVSTCGFWFLKSRDNYHQRFSMKCT